MLGTLVSFQETLSMEASIEIFNANKATLKCFKCKEIGTFAKAKPRLYCTNPKCHWRPFLRILLSKNNLIKKPERTYTKRAQPIPLPPPQPLPQPLSLQDDLVAENEGLKIQVAELQARCERLETKLKQVSARVEFMMAWDDPVNQIIIK
jgi:hypothetical protein